MISAFVIHTGKCVTELNWIWSGILFESIVQAGRHKTAQGLFVFFKASQTATSPAKVGFLKGLDLP